MPNSPPHPPPSPPSQPPQDHPPLDSQSPNNPNPNPNPNPQDQQAQPTLQDQQQQQQQQQQPDEPEPETMDLTLSPEPHTKPSKGSTLRRTKRKKGPKNRMTHAALERRIQQLSLGFKPIPFVPCKTLDFSKHEVFLKKLGLWDFSHIEFDRNIRVDLVMNLIIEYNVKIRGSYVNGVKIGVSRADIARALKLPLPKKGDCDVESFPEDFMSFLNEFVSKWMLLHDDPWAMPGDIVNYVNLIKEGSPHKVDWAGMIWCMMEKELGMKSGLKECYYASHLQHLVKVQKELLLSEGNEMAGVESSKETVALDDDDEDDDDGGDVKMVDVEESGSVGQKVDEEEMGVGLKVGQDCVGEVENVGGFEDVEKDGDCHAVDDGEKVEDTEKEMVEDAVKEEVEDALKDKVENAEKEKVDDVEKEKVGDAEKEEVEDVEKDKAEEVEDVDNEKEENDLEKFEDLSKHKEEHDIEKVEDAGKENNEDDIGYPDVVNDGNIVEVMETADVVENIDNVENMVDEIKDEEMTDYGDFKGEQLGQGQWLFDGNVEVKQFLRPCSMTDVNASTGYEDVDEDEEDDDVEEDEHIEGFKIMHKAAMDGMTSSNLMQGFGTGQMAFPSNELGSQSSLELMTSKADNNMMLGEPSMFNHSGKREIDHDDDMSHQVMNDNHKRMRVDGNWDNKVPEFGVCIAQLEQWAEKVKMSHLTATQEAYQQLNLAQNFFAEQLSVKDNEIAQWRYKCEEINSRKQADIDRLNRELYLMNRMIEGYRKALKQTQTTFAEYRRRCQVPDDPIYKDAGPGGVVKSVMELERERLKKEEEDRKTLIIIEQMFVKFANEFQFKCSGMILEKIDYQHCRLANAVKEVELLKDYYIKQKKPANVQNDPEAPSE